MMRLEELSDFPPPPELPRDVQSRLEDMSVPIEHRIVLARQTVVEYGPLALPIADYLAEREGALVGNRDNLDQLIEKLEILEALNETFKRFGFDPSGTEEVLANEWHTLSSTQPDLILWVVDVPTERMEAERIYPEGRQWAEGDHRISYKIVVLPPVIKPVPSPL